MCISFYISTIQNSLRFCVLQESFDEGKQVILTLKDQGVLEESGDVLVNVNLIDDEHSKKVCFISPLQC